MALSVISAARIKIRQYTRLKLNVPTVFIIDNIIQKSQYTVKRQRNDVGGKSSNTSFIYQIKLYSTRPCVVPCLMDSGM